MPMEEAFGYAKDILMHGGVGSSGLMDILHKYIDEDAFRASEIDYGLVVAELPSLKGHFLKKDDIPIGQLHDYILASASCFPVAKYHTINDVKYIDGGYADNFPIKMAYEMGAQRIIAVNLGEAGRMLKEEIDEVNRNTHLTVINPSRYLGNYMTFNAETSKRNIRLGYLDAMKTLGRYDGEKMTFRKRSFSKSVTSEADAAGEIFNIDPLVVYGKRKFNKLLEQKVVDASITLERIMKGGLKDKAEIKNLHSDAICVFIAKNIITNGRKSPFNGRIAGKAIKNHIDAAQYLIHSKMITNI